MVRVGMAEEFQLDLSDATLACEVDKIQGLLVVYVGSWMGCYKSWKNPCDKRKGDVMTVVYFTNDTMHNGWKLITCLLSSHHILQNGIRHTQNSTLHEHCTHG